MVTPEYNGSMSGALKLFIDLLPYPESFEGRPVCSSESHPDNSGPCDRWNIFSRFLATVTPTISPGRVFVPAVHEVLDAEKGILDEDLASRLEEQAGSFVEFCRKLGRL